MADPAQEQAVYGSIDKDVGQIEPCLAIGNREVPMNGSG